MTGATPSIFSFFSRFASPIESSFCDYIFVAIEIGVNKNPCAPVGVGIGIEFNNVSIAEQSSKFLNESIHFRCVHCDKYFAIAESSIWGINFSRHPEN
jgi:hypothetical protein